MSLGNRENRILADRYQLVDLIGTGAMGQVYRAEDQVLGGVTVAVKFLSQTLLNEKMQPKPLTTITSMKNGSNTS